LAVYETIVSMGVLEMITYLPEKVGILFKVVETTTASMVDWARMSSTAALGPTRS
jgi:hypothetical protein